VLLYRIYSSFLTIFCYSLSILSQSSLPLPFLASGDLSSSGRNTICFHSYRKVDFYGLGCYAKEFVPYLRGDKSLGKLSDIGRFAYWKDSFDSCRKKGKEHEWNGWGLGAHCSSPG
jgi:hypothetical protein